MALHDVDQKGGDQALENNELPNSKTKGIEISRNHADLFQNRFLKAK
jgi:hypothetical protein